MRKKLYFKDIPLHILLNSNFWFIDLYDKSLNRTITVSGYNPDIDKFFCDIDNKLEYLFYSDLKNLEILNFENLEGLNLFDI